MGADCSGLFSRLKTGQIVNSEYVHDNISTVKASQKHANVPDVIYAKAKKGTGAHFCQVREKMHDVFLYFGQQEHSGIQNIVTDDLKALTRYLRAVKHTRKKREAEYNSETKLTWTYVWNDIFGEESEFWDNKPTSEGILLTLAKAEHSKCPNFRQRTFEIS